VTLDPAPSTRIQLCGPVVIERDGERLDARLPGRQGRMLLAYLVLHRDRLASRDELAGAVWPRQLPAAPETGLSALISKLRKILGPGVIEGRAHLRLRLGDDARVDMEEAVAAVHRAESQVALGGWKHAWGSSLVAMFIAEREFLPEDDAPWIDEQRQQLQQIRLRALQAYATAALGIGGTELPAAERASRQLIALAPLRENGYQILMRALACQGNAAEALRVYAALCDLLRDELGVAPCAITQGVHAELIQAS
jgi:DNA-binding SARP family transcriptional activator